MENEFQFDIERYITKEKFDKIKEFSKDKETPFLVVDLEKVEEKYDELLNSLPFAKIYYAVKANPLEQVIRMLVRKGSNFDIASVYELDHVLAMGASPEKISYGNTIKKSKAIAYAYSRGVRMFATDSEGDLRKIAENAPGSRVFFRILTDGSGADWPLSRKFGAHPDTIYKLILLAGSGHIKFNADLDAVDFQDGTDPGVLKYEHLQCFKFLHQLLYFLLYRFFLGVAFCNDEELH